MHTTALLAAFLLTLGQTGMAASQDECDLIKVTLDELIRSNEHLALRDMVIKADRAAPIATQASAPAGAGANTGVDSPERPKWLALAIERGLANNNDRGGVTISLSPFDWISQGQPDGYFDDNGNYVDAQNWRRLTGSLSLGDRGEALDGDGDGSPEDPATAKAWNDSAQLELQYRFYGSRDRREVSQFGNSVASKVARSSELAMRATAEISKLFAEPDMVKRQIDLKKAVNESRYSCAEAAIQWAQVIRTNPATNSAAYRMIQTLAENEALRNDIVRDIDGNWVWTVGISALERKDYLGRDRQAISVRGLRGITNSESLFPENSTLIFNLDYARTESLQPHDSDLRSAVLGFEYIRPFGEGHAKPFDQARWAVSVSGEKTWNAPASAKKSQAVVGWRMEVPLAENVSVPLSIKWSNRNELLQDEDEIVGHIGVSINFESFFSARDGG